MIKSKSELVNTINSELSDNSTGDISPRDIRHNLIDIIDSVHNLIAGQAFDTAHYGTPDDASVRVGKESLSKLDLAGYTTSGNTAIGYAALQNNYQAIKNTAIGAYSLNCNVHGYDNAALGYSSLAGNTTGFGNVGIGSYSLQNNKLGDFNIAIGHGAGYYVTKNDSNKLYIGSHNVDSDYICANADGSGLLPAIYADMSLGIVGIRTRGVHEYGVLQTSGSIVPSVNLSFDLGHEDYKWRRAYIRDLKSSGISFYGGHSNPVLLGNVSGVTVSGDLLPFSHDSSDIGSTSRRWDNVYTRTLHAESGVITTSSNYVDKTLFLASSGTEGSFDGFLTESQVLDAGLVVRVSGMFDPAFVYDSSLSSSVCASGTNADPFRRWKSNVAIEIESGEFLRARSFINPETCVGLHWQSGVLFNTSRNIFHNDKDNIAGTGNINFVKDSGNADTEYAVSYIAQESGIDISQRFLFRADGISKQDGKDRLTGFVLKACDECGSQLSGSTNLDRFSISSFDNSSRTTNSMLLMKNNEEGGVFGINNFNNGDGSLGIPNTILNVRSTTDATARITSETTGDTQTRLQLLGECNSPADGLELKFSRTNHIGDLGIYQNSGLTNFIRLKPSGSAHNDHRVGILADGINDTLTVGKSGVEPAISMYSHSSYPSNSAGFGKIYVNEKSTTSQSHNLKFMDGSGNIFDLVKNPCDSTSDSVFSLYNNTVLGIGSVAQRCTLTPTALGNTSFGAKNLQSLDGGDYNSIFGYLSAASITTGSYNIAIGFRNLRNSSNSVSNNIVIGKSLGNNFTKSDALLIGNNNPIISGDMVTNNLFVPNGEFTVEGGDVNIESSNKLILKHTNGSDELRISTDKITTYDSGSEFPNQDLTFDFIGSGNTSNELLNLDHTASGMTNTPTYETPDPARPFAELKGDLKLQGAIRFSDGYSLDGKKLSDDLNYVSGVALGNYATLNGAFVEGYASGDISVASSYNSPSSGIVIEYNDPSKFYTIYNRDKYTKIKQDDYIIAIKVNGELRPIWVSNENSVCNCCVK